MEQPWRGSRSASHEDGSPVWRKDEWLKNKHCVCGDHVCDSVCGFPLQDTSPDLRGMIGMET